MFNISDIEEKIGYTFKKKNLIEQAFTHSSFSEKNNEILEFVGDSVLSLVVTSCIYNTCSHEGELSKLRSLIVCEENLVKTIKNLGLEKYIKLGSSIKVASNSILGDLCEAIIGAIYLDSDKNLNKVQLFIEKYISFDVYNNDYKTILQELMQKIGKNSIKYNTNLIAGQAHNPIFETTLLINEQIIATSTGKSKKLAEQNAAKIAIKKLTK